MDSEQFSEIAYAQFKICEDVLFDKGREYASLEDRLHNFRVAADLQNIPLQEALAGMMAKHTISLYDMCRSEEMAKFEVWDEKITDHINYLILLRAIIVEYEETQQEFTNEVQILFQKNKESGNA